MMKLQEASLVREANQLHCCNTEQSPESSSRSYEGLADLPVAVAARQVFEQSISQLLAWAVAQAAVACIQRCFAT